MTRRLKSDKFSPYAVVTRGRSLFLGRVMHRSGACVSDRENYCIFPRAHVQLYVWPRCLPQGPFFCVDFHYVKIHLRCLSPYIYFDTAYSRRIAVRAQDDALWCLGVFWENCLMALTPLLHVGM